MKKLFVQLFLFIFVIAPTVNAQKEKDSTKKKNTFSISGEFRTRFEYRNGAFRPLYTEEKAAIPIFNRNRLQLDYSYKDLIKTKLTFQNSNLWGEAMPTQKNDVSDNTLSVLEAWADIKIYKNLRAKVGRQMISLDDGRLFSACNWTNSGRSHDALQLYLSNKRWEGRAFFAFNQNYTTLYANNSNNPSGNLYNTEGAQSYKFMQTLWLNYNTDKYSNISFLFSNVSYQNADSLTAENNLNNLQTLGLFYHFNYTKIFGFATGYYQSGYATSKRYTNAYILAAGIGVKLKEKFHIELEGDYTSGDVYGTHAAQTHSFQHLFGTGHPFNGTMDYFFAGSPFAHVGLFDGAVKLAYHLNKRFDISLAGHTFITPKSFRIGNINYHQNLGQEIDAKVNFKINKFATLSAGYSTFFTTRTLRFLKYVPNATGYQDWAWISLNIHPKFFSAMF